MRFRTTLSIRLFLVSLSLLFALPSVCATPRVQDLCLGNGTPGPFSLSWKHVRLGTETVTVNGLPQLRGLDYTLDSDNGTITFTRSLPVRSAAEIAYDPDPAQAQRNGDGRTIPLSFDLMRGEHGYFSFNALGKQKEDTSGDLTLGVGMGWQGRNKSQLSSHLFYTPVTAASGLDTDTLAKRTGLSIAGSTMGGDWALFSFGFSRAGVSLENAGDDSLRAGQQLFTLSSRLTPTKMVQAQVNFSKSSPTDDPKTGPNTNTSVALTLTPSDKTQMSANIAQGANGTSGMTQAVGLSVSSRPTTNMEVSASFNGQDAPGTTNDTQAINLKTVLTPGKTLSIETSASQSRVGSAVNDQQTLRLSLTPRTTVQIGAVLALRQKATSGSADSLNTAVASINGTAHPLSFLEVSGSYKNRMAPDKDTDTKDLFDTSTARVALTPIKSVRLVGTYSQNPDNDGDSLQRLARKGIGLETTFGAVGLSGGYDWSRRYDAADIEQTIHADLGLRFSPATQLTVGFQTRQNALDPSTSQFLAYTVGFTHTLGDRFNLSLNGKRQQSAASASDYNASANLGMKF